jgi:exosortase A-associated hydrolase 2
MNKSRRMVALQARALAEDGLAVLLVDPLGCGDSPGDFGDATWETWVQDIANALAWLRREFARRHPGHDEPPRVLWGLRAGALLAAAAAGRAPGPCAMLLWQPSTSGRTVLQQFLRLLSAADLMTGKAQGAAAAARGALAAGHPQEVAGYRLSPGLALGLESASLEPAGSPSGLWAIELNTRSPTTPGPALLTALSRWQRAGWHTHTEVVNGPSFWQTSEIEDAPELIAATREAMRRLCNSSEPAGLPMPA